ncbi:adipokinetic hormone/corazonin-related peptide receptor variant I-like isoform X2 [Phymastichus coffea]|uniref:adipokinetic hormone/corazonin-related peptide receptor variant I-like isoform X2 n=1 Tax=Phymastichus coffea TaxID=108790 RepID=UPI00273C72E1|nr:adipokinetic hormone/corazonin-related peptide receptor variant I-like isoform X2 [Phymastichus coffea]
MDMEQLQPRIQIMQDFHNEFRNGSDFAPGYSDDSANGSALALPSAMVFTEQTLIIVIVYSACFLIASIGNLTVFLTLSRGRYRKSRISLMICHLSIADLLVAFFTIPIEIGWRITVQWIAGDVACKVLQFIRAFGLYLSNNILICVSLDRYFAVLYPLRMNDARRRGKFMLTVAWVSSIVYTIPQSIVFHVSTHPQHKNFTQCVSFESFPSDLFEKIYNVFCIVTMYFIPLTIICWVYLQILCEISSKSKDSKPDIIMSNSDGTISTSNANQKNRMRLRRSDMSSIERARSRTLKMTIKIVVAFILCWTPYITMSLWYVIDNESAKSVNYMVQESLFIMAVGNSCANPLVYGSYAIDFKKEFCRCFQSFTSRQPNVDVNIIQPSLGTNFQKSTEKPKSPGVSKRIVHSVRQAVQGLLKVGSQQTKSTGLNPKILVSPSPRLSVSSSSKGIAVEKMQLQVIKPIIRTASSEGDTHEPSSAVDDERQTV